VLAELSPDALVGRLIRIIRLFGRVDPLTERVHRLQTIQDVLATLPSLSELKKDQSSLRPILNFTPGGKL
jgi:hypothetical protein